MKKTLIDVQNENLKLEENLNNSKQLLNDLKKENLNLQVNSFLILEEEEEKKKELFYEKILDISKKSHALGAELSKQLENTSILIENIEKDGCENQEKLEEIVQLHCDTNAYLKTKKNWLLFASAAIAGSFVLGALGYAALKILKEKPANTNVVSLSFFNRYLISFSLKKNF